MVYVEGIFDTSEGWHNLTQNQVAQLRQLPMLNQDPSGNWGKWVPCVIDFTYRLFVGTTAHFDFRIQSHILSEAKTNPVINLMFPEMFTQQNMILMQIQLTGNGSVARYRCKQFNL